jgi:hypothetical protein
MTMPNPPLGEGMPAPSPMVGWGRDDAQLHVGSSMGVGSYGLVNHDSYKSQSLHWMRSKFIGSNRLCLKWENAIFDIPSLSKNYIPCIPILSWIEYSFHKNPD